MELYDGEQPARRTANVSSLRQSAPAPTKELPTRGRPREAELSDTRLPPRTSPGRPARRWSARSSRSGPREDTFARSVADTADGEPWTFYEGPPTANGTPGTHHVEARVFKDVFPRFKTMKGRHVARKAGWDCHGLPVEIAVEKELGFTGKPDIEAYGIAEFNAKCRESVAAPRRRVRGR